MAVRKISIGSILDYPGWPSMTSQQNGRENLAFEDDPADDSASTSPVEKKQGVTHAVSTEGLFRQYAGIGLSLLASLTYSSSSVLLQILNESYSFGPGNSAFWRHAGIMVISMPMLIYHQFWAPEGSLKHGSVFHGVWPFRENWRTVTLVAMRAIVGGLSIVLLFVSLAYLSVGDAFVIASSSPILVIILAHIFLGEKTGVVPVLAALLALAGVAFITQPPILTGESSFNSDQLIGSCFALGALVCTALTGILSRSVRQIQYTVSMISIGLVGMLESIPIVLFSDDGGFTMTRGLEDSLLLFGLVVLSYSGQLAVVLSLKFEQAGPVALVRSCDAVFGFLFQFLFLQVLPNQFSVIGGSLVFLSVLIVSIRKYLSTLPVENSCRRLFCCLLY